MSVDSPELFGSYVLELISRIRTVRSQCEILRSKDFATDAPCRLSETLIRISDYFQKATLVIFQSIDWSNTAKIKGSRSLLQITDYIVRNMEIHVNNIDSAQADKLPWSLVAPLKQLTGTLLPDIEIIMRPQWNYNYTIELKSLYDYYSDILKPYISLVDDEKVDDVLSALNKSFHVVSFPSLERDNVLLHSLLGHELGHLMSKGFFSEQRDQEFLQLAREKATKVVEEQQKALPSDYPPLFISSWRHQKTQREIERATKIWRRGLEELLADMIGAIVLGPAALFSSLDWALQTERFDVLPSEQNRFYPPWRTRLRTILSVVEEGDLVPVPAGKFRQSWVPTKVNERVGAIRAFVNEKSDRKAIESDLLIKFAYDEIDKDLAIAKARYRQELSNITINTRVFYDAVSHLVDRLDAGIPPNAHEETISERRPAMLVEIINAAWIHRLSWSEALVEDGRFNEVLVQKRLRMNNLTLKALELSHIENQYIDWVKKKTGNQPSYEDLKWVP